MIFGIIITSCSKDEWMEINTELSNSDYTFSERKLIRDSWKKYKLDRMDQTNLMLNHLSKKIRNIIKKFEHMTFKNCRELIEVVIKEYEIIKKEEEKIFDNSYINAIILMEYYINE